MEGGREGRREGGRKEGGWRGKAPSRFLEGTPILCEQGCQSTEAGTEPVLGGWCDGAAERSTRQQ